MSKFALGADPEMFLMDASKAFISAIGKIGGTKASPKPLDIGPGFAVQEDNVAIEYNIPPSWSRNEFVYNIDTVMAHLSGHVAALGLQFSQESAVSFPEEQLMDIESRTFGCDPDFNAWRGGTTNPRPKSEDWRLRTCGGHVHVGYDFTSDTEIIEFTKYLDLFFVGATLMDTGDLRKQLYGKAGAFRIKPYGMEYRSLSNFWVFTNETRSWVWDSTEMAMDAWQNKIIDVDSERKAILAAINKNNKDAARHLVSKYNLLVV